MILCTDISLEDKMNTLVLHFKNGKRHETLRWTLPRQIVLERDDQGRAVRTRGPFKNGKLKASVIYDCIADAMRHYCGPDAENIAERQTILAGQIDTFPARVMGNDVLLDRALTDIREWADRMLAADLGPYLLRRSLLRTFNSFASGRMMDDTEPNKTNDNQPS